MVVYPVCPPNKEKQNTDKMYAYLPTKINTQNVCVYTTVGVCMHSRENYAVHLAIALTQILVQVCTCCENTAWTCIQVAYMYMCMQSTRPSCTDQQDIRVQQSLSQNTSLWIVSPSIGHRQAPMYMYTCTIQRSK